MKVNNSEHLSAHTDKGQSPIKRSAKFNDKKASSAHN